MTTRPEIHDGPLVNHPDLWAFINDTLAAGQKVGEFPRLRTTPGGHEGVFWIGIEKAPVAFATVFEAQNGRCWLDLIWVSQPYRREGLAKALMLAVITAARQRGLKRIEFGTLIDNDAMRATGKLLSFAEDFIVMGRDI